MKIFRLQTLRWPSLRWLAVPILGIIAVVAALGCPDPKAVDPRFPPGIAGPVGGNQLPEPDALPEDLNAPPEGYFFCFWNVENLFDDRDDDRTKRGDTEYDKFFASQPKMLERKLDNLVEVLARMNHGKGPDILCLAEVEVNSRAPQLLMQAYNKRIGDPKRHLDTILFDDPNGGRDIGCAILTRLPTEKARTRLLGRRLRILEGHLVVNGHPLVVVASHWSSRISDSAGSTRATYGDVIYGRYRAMATANPAVDFLVCGDFNDPPDADSVVKNLRAIGDLNKVKAANREPLLYNLTWPLFERGEGTHFYRKWWLFDQIVVSPGLLDERGWSVLDDSVAIIREMRGRNGAPNRFGGPSDKRLLTNRGAADHFPVVCRLRVAEPSR
ncbi:MAG: endonuclease/exonuclease/phosphatase family protein [Gemmataceae bacterium]